MPTKAVVFLQTSTRRCGVAQDLHIAIVMGVYGLEQTSEHIFLVACPTVCSIFSPFIIMVTFSLLVCEAFF